MSTIKVITINYRDWSITDQLIRSLRKHGSNYDVQIYVVDNSDHNLGFARGINLGLASAKISDEDYVFIVNNDCIIDSNFFPPLLDSNFDLVSPLVYDYVGGQRRYDLGGKVDWLMGRHTHQHGNQKPNRNLFPDYLSGVAIFTRGLILKSIGYFNPKYFMYGEDVDWSLRARRLGYTFQIVVASTIFHQLSHSANQIGIKKLTYLANSHWQFTKDYLTPFWLITALPYQLWLRFKIIGASLFK